MLHKLQLATVVGIKHIKAWYKRCEDEDFTLFYIVFPSEDGIGQECAEIGMLSSEVDSDITIGTVVVMCSNDIYGRIDAVKKFNINDYLR